MHAVSRMLTVLAVAVPLCGFVAPALAADPDRDRTRDMDRMGEMDQTRDRDEDRLMDRLRTELHLNDAEVDGLGAEVRARLRAGGDAEQVRSMVQAAVGEGCRGTCLAATMHAMNRAMSRGQTAIQAREMVLTELHTAARDGNAAGLTERFEARVEKRLQMGMEDRSMDKSMERSMERGMERGMDHDMGSGRR